MTPVAYLPFLIQAVLAAAVTAAIIVRQHLSRPAGRSTRRSRTRRTSAACPSRRHRAHPLFGQVLPHRAALHAVRPGGRDPDPVDLHLPGILSLHHSPSSARSCFSSACWCSACSTRSRRARWSGRSKPSPPEPDAGPMRLDKIIARSRVIDLRSLDLEGALQELVGVAVAQLSGPEAGGAAQGPARPGEHDDDLPRPRRGAAARAGAR